MTGFIKYLLLVSLFIPVALNAASEDGLAAHWRFDAPSGKTAADLSGAGHTVELTGTPVWDNGLMFGENISATVKQTSGLDELEKGDFTIIVRGSFAKTPKAPDIVGRFSVKNGKFSGFRCNIRPNAEYLNFMVGHGNVVERAMAKFKEFAENGNHTIVFVYRAGTPEIYVDGQRRGSSFTHKRPWKNDIPQTPFAIGRDASNSFHFLKGRLGEIKIYKRALDPMEIKKDHLVLSGSSPNLLYNSSFRVCTNPGIPDYWSMPHRFSWTRNYPALPPDAYGLDPKTESPVPGTKVMRIHITPEIKGSFGISPNLSSYMPGDIYGSGIRTFSGYFKADHDNAKGEVILGNFQKFIPFTIGKKWKRVEIALPAKSRFYGVRFSGPGIYWMSAFQLEDSGKASSYQPGAFEKKYFSQNQKRPAPSLPEKMNFATREKPFIASGFFNRSKETANKTLQVKTFLEKGILHCRFEGMKASHAEDLSKKGSESSIFKNNTAEVFLCGDVTRPRYLHFASDRFGNRYDAEGLDPRWHNTQWSVQTENQGNGHWKAEFKIPLSVVAGDIGDVMGLAFCHSEHDGGKSTYRAWPLFNSPHRVSAFARFVPPSGFVGKCRQTAEKTAPITCVARHSFYTTRHREAEILFSIPQKASDVKYSVISKNGGVVAEGRASLKEGKSEARIDISALKPGQYTVNFFLPSGQISTALVKLEKSAIEVRVDRKYRCFERNGKPLFVNAHPVRMARPGMIPDKTLSDIRSNGFNALYTCLQAHRMSEADVRANIDQCFKAGLLVLSAHMEGNVIRRKGSIEELEKWMLSVVRKFKNHPGILAWYFCDEPAPSHWPYKPEDLKRLHDAIIKEDPYRPVFINYNQGGIFPAKLDVFGSVAATDVISIDNYPFRAGWEFRQEMLDRTLELAGIINRIGEIRERRPAGYFMQFYSDQCAIRELTPQEMRCIAFVNLIHGTRLLLWYGHQPMYRPMWNKVKELNAEMAELSDRFFFNSDAILEASGVSGRVHYAVWRKNGKRFLLFANASYENRPFRLPGDSFSRIFKPLECGMTELRSDSK